MNQLKKHPEDIGRPVEQTAQSKRELDRQLFHLQTLHDLSRELGSLIQPRKMLDSFLLMAMGTLGFTRGFAVFLHHPVSRGEIVSRGIPPADVEKMEKQMAAISSSRFPPGVLPPPSVRLIESDHPNGSHIFPPTISLVFQWAARDSCCGFFGFGGRISGDIRAKEDINFILNLANNLMSALNRTLSEENIRLLNTELLKRTEFLEETLEQVRSTKEDLDRRVFHLKAMYECAKELTGIVEVRQIMETFLLTAMGVFSVNQGCLLVYDSGMGRSVSSVRGMDGQQFENDPGKVQEIFYAAFTNLKDKNYLPFKIQPVSDTAIFDRFEFPMKVLTAFMFPVDEQCVGLLCFGETIFGDVLEQDELDLFDALITNFVTFLKSARAFEVIRNLNQDLTRSNRKLRRTIHELTEAEHKIDLLETAKNRIRMIIQSESEKIGRVSRLDLVLILLISLGLGILFNVSNPHGISILPHAWQNSVPPDISLENARKGWESGEVLFIDARPVELFDQGHIPGAVNLPAALFDFVYSMHSDTLNSGERIVLYGKTFSKRYDHEVSTILMNRGHENMRILSGGLAKWEENQMPVERRQ